MDENNFGAGNRFANGLEVSSPFDDDGENELARAGISGVLPEAREVFEHRGLFELAAVRPRQGEGIRIHTGVRHVSAAEQLVDLADDRRFADADGARDDEHRHTRVGGHQFGPMRVVCWSCQV